MTGAWKTPCLVSLYSFPWLKSITPCWSCSISGPRSVSPPVDAVQTTKGHLGTAFTEDASALGQASSNSQKCLKKKKEEKSMTGPSHLA